MTRIVFRLDGWRFTDILSGVVAGADKVSVDEEFWAINR